MTKKPHTSRAVILFSGIVLIVLSVVLFGAAMAIHDFGQQEQAVFFSGRSSILLAASFAILAVLAVVLLLSFTRLLSTSSPAAASTVSFEPANKRKSRPQAENSGDHKPASSAEPGNPAQVLSETAGELRSSVGAIEEELEDMLVEEDPADKEHVQALYQEADRLKKIIDGMEQLSQAQALARSVRKESIQLEPYLKEVMNRARSSAADPANITFTTECEPGLAVSADPECLTRVLGNILSNAVAAVKQGGSITLAAVRKGNHVVFSVRDTGMGIRSRHLPHIYERFFRGTGSGIGIGLAIVKELVDACGWEIAVESSPGKGTLFTVGLPAS